MSETDSRRKLTYSEYTSLLEMFAAKTVMMNAQNTLKARCKGVKNAWRQLRMISRALDDLALSLLMTVPTNDLIVLKEKIKYTKLNIYSDYVKMGDDKKTFVVLKQKTVVKLCDMATQNECYMCERKGKDVQKCKLKKLLDEVIQYEPPKMESGACNYAENNIDAIFEKSFEERAEKERKEING